MSRLLTFLKTLPLALYLWAGGAVVIAVFVAGLIAHERSVGALNQKLAVEQLRGDSLAKDTVKTHKVAQEAVKQAETANTAARAQVAAGKALQATTDRAARDASAERDAANKILADSLATIDALHASLFNLVAASRADSAAAAHQHAADTHTIGALLVTITADSVALAAEQFHSRALAELNQSVNKELKLVRQSMPSGFTKYVFGTVGLVGGILAGRGSK